MYKQRNNLVCIIFFENNLSFFFALATNSENDKTGLVVTIAHVGISKK